MRHALQAATAGLLALVLFGTNAVTVLVSVSFLCGVVWVKTAQAVEQAVEEVSRDGRDE